MIGLGLSDLQDQINRIGNQEIHMDIPESSHINDNEINTFLNTVSRVIFQRWEISLTIVVKDLYIYIYIYIYIYHIKVIKTKKSKVYLHRF